MHFISLRSYMLIHRPVICAVFTVACIITASGCVTTDDQVVNTVYGTNKLARNLDKNLGTVVEHLNETAADLDAKVQANDNETNRLRGLAEENSHRIQQLQEQLNQLTHTLHRQWGIPEINNTQSPPPGLLPGNELSQVQPSSAEVSVSNEASSEQTPSLVTEAPTTGVSTAANTLNQEAVAATVFQEAQRTYQQGNFALARDQFDSFFKKYRTSQYAGSALFWSAECQNKLGMQKNDETILKDAIHRYDQFRSEYPSSKYVPWAMYNESMAFIKLNRNKQAKQLLESLSKNYPTTKPGEAAKQKLAEISAASR